VTVNGTKADGPALIMSRSVEQYVATTKVPIWGGPQNLRVDVRTKIRDVQGADGPFRQARANTFVIPWVMLVLLVGLLVAGFFGRRRWQKRGSKYAEMKADMRRIERLLAEQRAGAEVAANGNGKPESPEQAIKAAMKRAARAGDAKAEQKLRDKLEEHRRADSTPQPPPAAAPRPEPVAAAPAPVPEPEPLRQAPEPVMAPPEVTVVDGATMTGHGNAPAAEADSLAVTLIRSALERARAVGDDAEVARLQAKLEREKARS
jgi:hypothetical protein